MIYIYMQAALRVRHFPYVHGSTNTYINTSKSWGQSCLAWSVADPMIVNPSCHICLGKNGEIIAWPYPVAPPGERSAFNFRSTGRENNLRVSDSTSSISSVGMPWPVNWKTPHFSDASVMSSGAFGSLRSMTGTEKHELVVPEWTPYGYWYSSSDSDHTWDSGTVWIEPKSRGMIWFLEESDRAPMGEIGNVQSEQKEKKKRKKDQGSMRVSLHVLWFER